MSAFIEKTKRNRAPIKPRIYRDYARRWFKWWDQINVLIVCPGALYIVCGPFLCAFVTIALLWIRILSELANIDTEYQRFYLYVNSICLIKINDLCMALYQNGILVFFFLHLKMDYYLSNSLLTMSKEKLNIVYCFYSDFLICFIDIKSDYFSSKVK